MAAVQSGPTSIIVTWTHPSPLGDTTGYRISFSGGGGYDSVVVSGANTSSYILTELSNGHVYSISVATTVSVSFPSLPVQAATVSLGKYKMWDIFLLIIMVLYSHSSIHRSSYS